MNNIVKQLENQREQVQNSLITFLDGLPNELITAICVAVVDHYNEKIEQYKGKW